MSLIFDALKKSQGHTVAAMPAAATNPSARHFRAGAYAQSEGAQARPWPFLLKAGVCVVGAALAGLATYQAGRVAGEHPAAVLGEQALAQALRVEAPPLPAPVPAPAQAPAQAPAFAPSPERPAAAQALGAEHDAVALSAVKPPAAGPIPSAASPAEAPQREATTVTRVRTDATPAPSMPKQPEPAQVAQAQVAQAQVGQPQPQPQPQVPAPARVQAASATTQGLVAPVNARAGASNDISSGGAASPSVPPRNAAARIQVTAESPPFAAQETFQQFLRQVQMQQWPEAQASADQITRALGPRHVVSLRAMGYLALKQNDLPLAKTNYLALLQILPEDREAGLNLALIDWRIGDKDAALRRVNSLGERFPNDSEVRALAQSVRAP